MKKIFLLILLFLNGIAIQINAQVTIGENKPAEIFSVLEIVSNGDKGLRLPQLTTAERDALAGEIKAITDADKKKLAEGLVIFNKETKCMDFWNGSKWVQMCLGSSIAGQPELSGNYRLSGKTCFDVKQINDDATCGFLPSRRDDFATTPYSFSYQFIHSSSYTGLSFALGGENASIAKVTYAGTTATVTFTDTIVKFAKGKDKKHALNLELIARYSDNTGIFRQISLPISVQDCSCGCTVRSTLPAGWLTFMCYNLGVPESTKQMSIAEQMNYNSPTGPGVTDSIIYGALYQWGRKADGHEKRNSLRYPTENDNVENGALADTDLDGNGQVPIGHDVYGKFIKNNNVPHYDWRISRCDTLWKDVVKTVNDPCPDGWRIPTNAEWSSITYNVSGISSSWQDAGSSGNKVHWNGSSNTHGLEISTDNGGTTALFLPAAGNRNYATGAFSNVGSGGYYWSSTPSGTVAYDLGFGNFAVGPGGTASRGRGQSVRCVAEE